MKRSVTGLGLLAALCLILSPAQSGVCTKHDSEICACNCLADLEINGQEKEMAFSGSMDMLCGDSYLENGRATTEMAVTAFDVESDVSDPVVGIVTIALDNTRPVATTMWIANQSGSEIPATHTVYAHCTLSFSNLPGVTWRSKNPFVMVNPDATTFQPSINEVYTLAEVVEFEDVSDPGPVVGRLLSSTITVDH